MKKKVDEFLKIYDNNYDEEIDIEELINKRDKFNEELDKVKEIVDAIKKGGVAFQNMFETKVRYLISERIKGEAEAVALICPLISEQMSESEQALEAAGACRLGDESFTSAPQLTRGPLGGPRKQDMNREMEPCDRPNRFERTFNKLFGLLIGLGLGLPHNYLLQVRGRRSGRKSSTASHRPC